MGIDADQQVAGRDRAQLGRPIAMDDEVKRRIDALWSELDL